MARCVIEAEILGEKRFFAGYQAESFGDCGPIWNKTITERSRYLDDLADKALEQLWQMGWACSKRILLEKRKKGAQVG